MSRPSKILNALSDWGTQVQAASLAPDEPLSSYQGAVRRDGSITSARGPKERSNLAFAAGFAALAYLFQFPIASLFFDFVPAGSGIIAAILALSMNLVALLAFWLGVIGWAGLKRKPYQSGRLPATIGLIVGFWGTLNLILGLYHLSRFLSGSG